MLTKHIGLIAQTSKIQPSELSATVDALQAQIVDDFGPIWNQKAQISGFSRLEDIPLGFWPILIQDDIRTPDAAGLHEDENGQPFALVQYSEQWSLTASHEMLEMLVDPFGRRLVAGPSPVPNQGQVEFLVEVCDPCEDPAVAYSGAHGITVSDFYTPHFFDPSPAVGARYSYTGSIKAPRTILKGGYLSWRVPETNEWFQQIWFDTAGPVVRSLGVLSGKLEGSIRSTIDRLTPTPLELSAYTGARGSQVWEHGMKGRRAKAAALQTRIEGLLAHR